MSSEASINKNLTKYGNLSYLEEIIGLSTIKISTLPLLNLGIILPIKSL